MADLPSNVREVAPFRFEFKKRPSGAGLRRNHKVSRATAPKPVTEQTESKAIWKLEKKVNHRVDVKDETPAMEKIPVETLYTWKSSGQEPTWQKIVIRKKYEVEFSENIVTMGCPEQVYMMCLMDLASRQYQDLGSFFMFLGFELRHDEIDYPICLPYKPIDAIDDMLLLDTLETLKRTKGKLPTITHAKFSVTLCFVKQMTGSGMPAKKRKIVKDAELIITRNNVSEYCLATAILQGMKYVAHCEDTTDFQKECDWLFYSNIDDTDDKYKEVMKEAKGWLASVEIDKATDFTIKDVETFQKALDGKYQLLVFSSSHTRAPVFKGPSLMEKNVIALVCKDGHFQHIRLLSRFVGSKFYCITCNVAYASKNVHYSCPLRCRQCLHSDCYADNNVEIHCEDCDTCFYSQQCFDNHKKALPGIKSRCTSTKKCPDCKKTIVDKGASHKCNHVYCMPCLRVMPSGHQCILCKTTRKENRIVKKLIIFHVECESVQQAGGSRVEKPIMAMALRCCTVCSPLDVPAKLSSAISAQCKNCSGAGHRFFQSECLSPSNRKIDVMRQLMEYIIHYNHAKFTAVMHDMPECVSDYILSYITKASVPKSKRIAMENGRLKSIVIDKTLTKIMDSKYMMDADMDELSANSGVPDIWHSTTHSFFPKSFVNPTRYNYCGPLPQVDYYLAGAKSTLEMEHMKRWHREMSGRMLAFHLIENLMEWTYAKLVRSCATIRRLDAAAVKILGINILCEADDYDTVAMRAFRRTFMANEQLRLDKGVKRSVTQTFSMVGSKYLAWRTRHEGLPIDTCLNVGEYKVPNTPYNIDGFIRPCTKYPRGLGIDVKGCYWHAHGCTYVPQMVARRELNSETIRENDRNREILIRQQCDLETVWECEIAIDRRTNRDMDEGMNNCTFPGPADIREALFPLRKEAINLHCEADEEWEIRVRDISGLPLESMKLDAFPNGEFRRQHGELFAVPITSGPQLRASLPSAEPRGFMFCKVMPPPLLHFPVLPFKANGYVVYTLCRSCSTAVVRPIPACEHSDTERMLTGTWSTFELELALDKGYQIVEVFGTALWVDWMQYNRTGDEISHGTFSQYADAMLAMNVIGSDCVDPTVLARDAYNVHGINVDPQLIRKNPYAIKCSTRLQDLWKVFADRTERPKTQMLDSAGALWEQLEQPTDQINEIKIVNDEKLFISSGTLAENATPTVETCSYITALVSAYCRIRLYKLIHTIENPALNVLYMDDKRLIYRCRRGLCGGPLDVSYLQPKEITGSITKYWAANPTTYVLTEQLPSRKIKLHVENDGFGGGAAANKRRGMATYKRLEEVTQRSANGVDIVYRSIVRNGHHLLMIGTKTRRVYTSFDWRTVEQSGRTVPIGSQNRYSI